MPRRITSCNAGPTLPEVNGLLFVELNVTSNRAKCRPESRSRQWIMSHERPCNKLATGRLQLIVPRPWLQGRGLPDLQLQDPPC
jgi:hypothetical protein